MESFFGAAFWFVVTLGVLVTFHEFGHFWVARRFGVRQHLIHFIERTARSVQNRKPRRERLHRDTGLDKL